VNKENKFPSERGLTADAINYYFGGLFDPTIHVPQLNNLTTVVRMIYRVSNAQHFLLGIRNGVANSLSKAQPGTQATVPDQGSASVTNNLAAAEKMMKSSLMGVVEKSALDLLSQSNTVPGADVMDLLR
jgi:hypothetical protein